MPKLSVIMPTYKDEKYLVEAITAILTQSYRDFELIIVNDGSPDNSEAIIKQFQKTDERIKYLRNETNKGVVHAATRAFKVAEGEYISFASSDDKILPGFYEATMCRLLKNNAIPICVTDFGYFFDKTPQHTIISKLLPSCTKQATFGSKETLAIYKSSHFWIPSNASIFKKSEAKKRGFLIEEIGYSCDHVLVNSIALTGGMIYIPENFTLMRILPKEESRSAQCKRKDLLKAEDNYINYIKSNKELWKMFYSSTLLVRRMNVRYFTLFLWPKHWDILVPMFSMKLKLFIRKISRQVLKRLSFRDQESAS